MEHSIELIKQIIADIEAELENNNYDFSTQDHLRGKLDAFNICLDILEENK